MSGDEESRTVLIALAGARVKAMQEVQVPVDPDDDRDPHTVACEIVERHRLRVVDIGELVDCRPRGTVQYQRPLGQPGPGTFVLDRYRFTFKFSGSRDLLQRSSRLKDGAGRDLLIEVHDSEHVSATVELCPNEASDLKDVAEDIRAAICEWQQRVRPVVEKETAEMATDVQQTWTSRVAASRSRSDSLRDLELPGYSEIEPDRSNLVDGLAVNALPAELPESDTTGNWTVDISTLDRLYDRACELIDRWASAVKKHPAAIPTAEEHARGNLLLMLNTHFQSANGEAFNTAGKTDVLIEAAGKNVLVAECKWWRGETSLHKALLQLLHYANGDNTRLVVLMFCKQKDVKEVREKAHAFLVSATSLVKSGSYPAVSSLAVTPLGDLDCEQSRQDYQVALAGMEAWLRLFVVEFPHELEAGEDNSKAAE